MAIWRVQITTLEVHMFSILETTCLFLNLSKVQNYLNINQLKKHALLIIITKSWEVRILILFVLMFHCRFADMTKVSLCKSNT